MPNRSSRAAPTRRIGLFAAPVLLILLIFQAWAYYSRLSLSLGPRVILEPWLLRQGEMLYEGVADLHTPLMPLTISWITRLVPDGLSAARLTLVGLLTLTTLLTFVVAWKRIGWGAGLWAAAFLVVWSPDFGFSKLWHESFLAPLYLLMLLCYRSSARRPALSSLLAGFLGGMAVLVKQHALLVLGGYAAWAAWTCWLEDRSSRGVVRDLALIGGAALLPLAAFAAYQLAHAGTLSGFWYWTVEYGLTSDYGPLAAQAPSRDQVLSLFCAGLLLPAALACAVRSARAGEAGWQTAGLALVLLVASSGTAYPRYNRFHLQATLPLLAWLSAWALGGLWRARGSWRRVALAAGTALSILWICTAGARYRPILRGGSAQAILEYSSLVPLAREIRQAIGEDACVYLFPDDEATANLYYLLGCHTPSFWIFHYPWYLTETIRGRILATLEADPPEWIVHFPGRWGAEALAPDLMGYIEAHYRIEALLSWPEGQVQLLRRQP